MLWFYALWKVYQDLLVKMWQPLVNNEAYRVLQKGAVVKNK